MSAGAVQLRPIAPSSSVNVRSVTTPGVPATTTVFDVATGPSPFAFFANTSATTVSPVFKPVSVTGPATFEFQLSSTKAAELIENFTTYSSIPRAPSVPGSQSNVTCPTPATRTRFCTNPGGP